MKPTIRLPPTKPALCAASISAAIRARIPKPNRVMAPVRWYGGKGNIAKSILPLIPPGRVYVEPYCGAASLFWHREPSPVEVLNDLHSEIINLWRVLQDRESFDALAHRLTWTPYSLDEFRRALKMGHEPDLSSVDRAWAFFVRQNQGFGGTATCDGDWGRAFVSGRGMAENANKWRGRLHLLDWWHSRLSRVQLDSRDALTVIRYWDSPDTVFYIDPPYISDTRVKGKRAMYRYEADDDHHRQLVGLLLNIQGRAAMSGYDHPAYQPLTDAGWSVHRIRTACHAAGRIRGSKLRGLGNAAKHAARVEVVWVKG